MLQVAFGPRATWAQPLAVIATSVGLGPAVVTVAAVTLPVPVFVTTNVCTRLQASLKLTAAGVRLRPATGMTPTPVKAAVAVVVPATVRVAAAGPTAEGMKIRIMLQVPPAGSMV